jgi:C-terminal processing protease CtpA/Prc
LIPAVSDHKAGEKKTAWFHYGVSTGSRASIYLSKRVLSDGKKYAQTSSRDDGMERHEVPREMIDKFPSPDSLQTYDLGNGITALMPISLYVNDVGTIPYGKGNKRDTLEYGFTPSGNDRYVRLADVAIAWNIFQHFYPYFDVGSIDWKPVLDETLIAAAAAKDESEFTIVLQRMVAKLKDGHGNVYLSKHYPYFSQFTTSIIEDNVIVTELSKGYKGKLKVGDVITDINGTPAQQFVADKKRSISSATEQWSNYIVGASLLSDIDTNSASLTVLHADGSTESIDELLTKTYPVRPDPKLKIVQEVKPGVLYVNLDKITASMFDSSIEELSKAKAIIFDLRGYPRGIMTESISHLIDSTVWCAYWTIPLHMYPDQRNTMWDTSRWSITPQSPRFTKNIVHLTNGKAISAAETYMGIIEYYKIGEIIGSTTAGTNGNVNPFTLPGGYSVSWTGMRVIKHDGTRHHGIGIKPTIECKPTVQGIRDGRDEILEKAIEVVESKMK